MLITVAVMVHSRNLLLSLSTPRKQSADAPSSSCRASKKSTKNLSPRLQVLMVVTCLLSITQRTVLYICARKVSMKKVLALNQCRCSFMKPVSMVAVLPMSMSAPVMPSTSGISGWYLRRCMECYRASVCRRKWLVSQPRTMSTEPEMVASRKTKYSGQCCATLLMYWCGNGGQWWQYCDWKYITKRLTIAHVAPTSRKPQAGNLPENIYKYQIANIGILGNQLLGQVGITSICFEGVLVIETLYVFAQNIEIYSDCVGANPLQNYSQIAAHCLIAVHSLTGEYCINFGLGVKISHNEQSNGYGSFEYEKGFISGFCVYFYDPIEHCVVNDSEEGHHEEGGRAVHVPLLVFLTCVEGSSADGQQHGAHHSQNHWNLWLVLCDVKGVLNGDGFEVEVVCHPTKDHHYGTGDSGESKEQKFGVMPGTATDPRNFLLMSVVLSDEVDECNGEDECDSEGFEEDGGVEMSEKHGFTNEIINFIEQKMLLTVIYLLVVNICGIFQTIPCVNMNSHILNQYKIIEACSQEFCAGTD